jgi:Domain of unknown function (DUF4189)
MRALLIAALLFAQAPSGAAVAAGAIAIGSSGNVANDGVATGGAIDQPTSEQAVAKALETCRGFKGAPKVSGLCRVVETFARQCAAIAFNPAKGKPGLGWALAFDKTAAEQRALAACRDTGGGLGCRIDQSYCDTHD